MTDKEIIEVVQAHAEGKQIQYYNDQEWIDWVDDEPCWDFSTHKYRVKPESKIRPYKNEEECWNDMLKHQPFGWVKNKYSGSYLCLAAISTSSNFEWLLKTYIYIDDSPFGIIEE